MRRWVHPASSATPSAAACCLQFPLRAFAAPRRPAPLRRRSLGSMSPRPATASCPAWCAGRVHPGHAAARHHAQVPRAVCAAGALCAASAAFAAPRSGCILWCLRASGVPCSLATERSVNPNAAHIPAAGRTTTQTPGRWRSTSALTSSSCGSASRAAVPGAVTTTAPQTVRLGRRRRQPPVTAALRRRPCSCRAPLHEGCLRSPPCDP